jgi:hypothetical protein
MAGGPRGEGFQSANGTIQLPQDLVPSRIVLMVAPPIAGGPGRSRGTMSSKAIGRDSSSEISDLTESN